MLKEKIEECENESVPHWHLYCYDLTLAEGHLV